MSSTMQVAVYCIGAVATLIILLRIQAKATGILTGADIIAVLFMACGWPATASLYFCFRVLLFLHKTTVWRRK